MKNSLTIVSRTQTSYESIQSNLSTNYWSERGLRLANHPKIVPLRRKCQGNERRTAAATAACALENVKVASRKYLIHSRQTGS